MGWREGRDGSREAGLRRGAAPPPACDCRASDRPAGQGRGVPRKSARGAGLAGATGEPLPVTWLLLPRETLRALPPPGLRGSGGVPDRRDRIRQTDWAGGRPRQAGGRSGSSSVSLDPVQGCRPVADRGRRGSAAKSCVRPSPGRHRAPVLRPRGGN